LERRQIAEFIGLNTLKFKKSIDGAERAISLMQERRTALISAAVTGKIDVRNWVAPKSSDIKKNVEA
jgi:type I restriction enzyme S subunit